MFFGFLNYQSYFSLLKKKSNPNVNAIENNSLPALRTGHSLTTETLQTFNVQKANWSLDGFPLDPKFYITTSIPNARQDQEHYFFETKTQVNQSTPVRANSLPFSWHSSKTTSIRFKILLEFFL